MVLGAVLAMGLMLLMQVPLLHRSAVATMTLAPVGSAPGATTPIAWPSVGSAALVIPSLGVSKSWNDRVMPIASLTKMMTAYVVLKKLPLAPGQTGPCVTVSASDVIAYQQMVATDQSSVLVVSGESLCEFDLLDGLLVHSASNYAALLATMVSPATSDFITLMNQTAAALHLTGTTYADVSGYADGSVSTALDQAKLAILLMKSPLVRSIVSQPSVTLPVAGTVGSFTPYVGFDNVIGVKSGRTSAAGGCDVMAMTFQQGASTQTLYAVVLGQRGGDLLGPAGDAAFALANSALAHHLHHVFAKGATVGTLTWGGRDVPFGMAAREEIWWWSAQNRLSMTLDMKRLTGAVRRGDVVGWLVVRGATSGRFALSAERTASPPSLWQRLL